MDIDHLVDLYKSGESATKIAAMVGASAETVLRRLKGAGVRIRTGAETAALALDKMTPDERRAAFGALAAASAAVVRRNDLDAIAQEIAAAYVAGDSTRTLARRHRCSQPTIRRILSDAGVTARTLSEAGRIRAAAESMAMRQHRARGTLGRLGVPISDGSLAARAQAKQASKSLIGRFENELTEWLDAAGLEPRQQFAVSRYNLDIAVGTIAVEVHTHRHSPRSPARVAAIQRRVDALADLGWSSFYVWCHYGITPGDACNVVARLYEMSRNPPARGEYRVLRCHGYPPTPGRGYRYKLPLIPSASRISDAMREHLRVARDA